MRPRNPRPPRRSSGRSARAAIVIGDGPRPLTRPVAGAVRVSSDGDGVVDDVLSPPGRGHDELPRTISDAIELMLDNAVAGGSKDQPAMRFAVALFERTPAAGDVGQARPAVRRSRGAAGGGSGRGRGDLHKNSSAVRISYLRERCAARRSQPHRAEATSGTPLFVCRSLGRQPEQSARRARRALLTPRSGTRP